MIQNQHASLPGGEADDRALAFFDELQESGMEADAALDAALVEFPGQASLLADYALHQAVMTYRASSPVTDPLEEVVEQRVVAVAARLAGTEIDSLIARAGQVGIGAAGLCQRLKISATLLQKLERGLIAAASIPARFIRRLADELQLSVESVRSYVATGGPRLGIDSDYKSPRRPRAKTETFAAAIARAVKMKEMSEADQRYWSETDGGEA